MNRIKRRSAEHSISIEIKNYRQNEENAPLQMRFLKNYAGLAIG